VSVLSAGRAPRVLVLGGTGAIGAGVVERAAELGLPVTCVASRAQPSPLLRDGLLGPRGVPYVALDVFSEQALPDLQQLLDAHDLAILACEPWSGEDEPALRGVEGTVRIYQTATRCGFTAEENARRRAAGKTPRRVVRIGSSAAELPLDLLGASGGVERWPEERVSQADLERVAASDPCWDNAYFGSKVLQARNAREAVCGGLDLVTVLPTYVVSWWGEYGGHEPLVRLLRTARTTGCLPRTPLNAVPVDAAATGILLAALCGAVGERYQLAGIDTDTWAVHAASMRFATPPVRDPLPIPLPRAELLDELRLLRRERRSQAWLDVWLLPWDGFRRALLELYRIEPWHLALLAQGGHRSGARLRALGDSLPAFLSALRFPDAEDLRARLDHAARRKMEWLERIGALAC
jgi:nucleoside-diphosphate-sugar epimerase